jgi:hypothetical protein
MKHDINDVLMIIIMMIAIITIMKIMNPSYVQEMKDADGES